MKKLFLNLIFLFICVNCLTAQESYLPISDINKKMPEVNVLKPFNSHIRMEFERAESLSIPKSFQATAGSKENVNITFNGETRILSVYVPSDYDEDTPARLFIGLHGSGDKSSNYLTALLYYKYDETYLKNTIIICPDGGDDDVRDFYAPEGDEEIIQAAIDYAKANYNIDESEIILQGFSLGGRSALRYGLTYPEKFKALLLNTPAVQGVMEANRLFDEGGVYNYANGSKIPIYVTWGKQDENYVGPVSQMVYQLVYNDAIIKYKSLDIGHSMPQMSELDELEDFINLNMPEESMRFLRVGSPRTYTNEGNVSLLFYNLGTEAVTKIGITHKIEDNVDTYEWTGELNQFHHLEINMPFTVNKDGSFTLSLYVNSINEQTFEEQYIDVSSWAVLTPHSLPYNQDFSTGDNINRVYEWTFLTSGEYFMPWSWGAYQGNYYFYCFNTLFFFDSEGKKEEMISPYMDLTTIDNPTLAFDLAYNYMTYTFIEYETLNEFILDFVDTLEVSISTDYGKTFHPIYRKAGDELRTFDSPLHDKYINEILMVEPSKSEWVRQYIDLSDYANETKVLFKFTNISGNGGVMFLDNVSFSNEVSTGELQINENNVLIYPNPATDVIYIENATDSKIRIFDTTGKLMLEKNTQSIKEMLQISHLEKGIYFMEISGKEGKIFNKIVKR